MYLALVALILLILRPATACGQEVLSQLEEAVALVGTAVERTFARSVPLPAASAGVSYSFDADTGNFQRDPSTFGQVYLERADPIGANRLNLSFVYQYMELDEIDGHDADSLSTTAPIPLEGLFAAFDIPRLSVGASVHEFLFAATYGIGDDFEASVALPLMYSNNDAEVRFNIAALIEDEGLQLFEEQTTIEENPVGVGDLLLRGKYRFLELSDVHLAAGLLLRIPTGTEEDLQGIGFFQVTPSLLASTRSYRPASWARLQGYFNAGIEFDTEDVDNSDARWGFGLDWGFTDRLTASIAFLAQNQFARVAPPGTFTFPACSSDLLTCAVDPSVRDSTQDLFGLSGDRPDYYDLSIGGRGALWRDTVFAFVNVAIPLNDGFVRTKPIPLIGFEGTF